MGRLLKASTDELDAKRKDILQLTADATDFEAIGKVFDAMQVLAKEVVAKPNKAISDSEWVPDHIRTKFCKNLARMGSGNDAKYRKSLPNRKQQGAPSPPPPRARRFALPRWVVVFCLVKTSCVLLHFRGPFWADFQNLMPIWSGTRSGFEIVLFDFPRLPTMLDQVSRSRSARKGKTKLCRKPRRRKQKAARKNRPRRRMGKPRKVDGPKKGKVEKLQDEPRNHAKA